MADPKKSTLIQLKHENQDAQLNPEENAAKKSVKIKLTDSQVNESIQILNKTALNVLEAMPSFKI